MFEYVKPEQKQKDKSKNVVQKQKEQEHTMRPNLTGIPNATKERFENMSGFSFDDVRVHYNSDKPAQLQALAYTQGNQVYVAPGQEKHLGHELGHVVQQKQGRVSGYEKINGIRINNDLDLERDADIKYKTSKKFGSTILNEVHTHNIVQCIKLNLEQCETMISKEIERLDYENLVYYCKDDTRKFGIKNDFESLLFEYISERLFARVPTYSHNDEIQFNEDALSNELGIQLTVNKVDDIRNHFIAKMIEIDERKDDVKEHSDLPEIVYDTKKLQLFIENDEDIKGTITNIRIHSGKGGTSQAMEVGGHKVFHKHIRGGDALAYYLEGKTIHIAGYGKKSDSAQNGSGGYIWYTQPK